MRTSFSLPILAVIFTALSVFPDVQAQNSTARLDLEQSSDGLKSWQRIPISPAMLNHGSIDMSAVSSSAFYRMKVDVFPTSPYKGNLITVQGGMLPQASELSGQLVATFQIGKYEVTWDEWQIIRAWAVNYGYGDLANVGAGSAGLHPVREVNWYDAVKWCNAKSEKEGLVPVYQLQGATYRIGENIPSINISANGYRLPTDAEWEWAARGGVKSEGFVYSGSNDLNTVAWYWENSNGSEVAISPFLYGYESRGTWPVGQKAANELGLYDMSGNVWEWCFDPLNTSSRRFRGGTWSQENAFYAVFFLVAYRGDHDADLRMPEMGFRLARNAP